MRVLVIAAHPDDEVLGCGATVARLADEGNEVHIAILGEGITSRYDVPTAAAPDELVRLRAAADAAAAILGAASSSIVGLPDNRFDTVALLEIVKHIESFVDRIRPEEVFVQHGGDLNIDHQLTYRATLAATRPQPGHPVREVHAFEVASSTEWAFQSFAPVFHPNLFIDVSATIDRKIAAIAAYESEMRPFPHPRSPDALRAAAARWGAAVGVNAAEAFQTVRATR